MHEQKEIGGVGGDGLKGQLPAEIFDALDGERERKVNVPERFSARCSRSASFTAPLAMMSLYRGRAWAATTLGRAPLLALWPCRGALASWRSALN